MLQLPPEDMPVFVGGGVANTVSAARSVAYYATGGTEGVATPGSLKVRALTVPGGYITVDPGVFSVLQNTSSSKLECYVGRIGQRKTVEVAPNTAGGTRFFLVVVAINDPWVDGTTFSPPGSLDGYNPARIEIVGPVPAATTDVHQHTGWAGRNAVTLAKIQMENNVATITNDMITDLRSLSKTNTFRFVDTTTGQDNSTQAPLTSPSMTDWPGSPWFDADVPPWATHAAVKCTIFGAQVSLGTGTGSRGCWGEIQGAFLGQLTKNAGYNERWDGAPARTSVGFASRMTVPAAMRGTTQRLKLRGRRGGGTDMLKLNSGTTIVVEVDFEERLI